MADDDPTPLATDSGDTTGGDTATGVPGTAGVVVEHWKLQDGDCVLLCTNGLTDVVDDERLAGVLARPDTLDQKCQALVDLALAHGSDDNITVVLAKYSLPGVAGRG